MLTAWCVQLTTQSVPLARPSPLTTWMVVLVLTVLRPTSQVMTSAVLALLKVLLSRILESVRNIVEMGNCFHLPTNAMMTILLTETDVAVNVKLSKASCANENPTLHQTLAM